MSDFQTSSETARELGVSVETVRVWAATGRLPVTRTSGGWRIFKRDDVQRLKEARTSGAHRTTPRAPTAA